jgi:hypothetical protein
MWGSEYPVARANAKCQRLSPSASARAKSESISGAYILNCEDEAKLHDLADELDKLNEQILKDSKAEIGDGQHRLIKGFELTQQERNTHAHTI